MSADSKIVVTDQWADPVAGGEPLLALSSGLSHVDMTNKADAADNKSGVSLLIKPVTGLLMIRTGTAADDVSNALQAHCALPLSTRLQSTVQDEYCIRWMSPDCWLLSCPLQQCHAIESALRDAVSGHMAIVNVSGGYTCLELSGQHARDVLMKSTGYDTHPDHLAPGKVVNTTFAKAQVTLRCVEVTEAMQGSTDGCYELIVRRSFSDYVWLWIQRAAAEYGLITRHDGVSRHDGVTQ